ncbi:MAG: DUF58 domain-containing protein [Stagnimonas sp.]|nr:DUF58 domain-containing protein [Stagnimonas sp.]
MRIRPVLNVTPPEAWNRDGRDPFLARLGMVLFHPLRSIRQRINRWVASRVSRQAGPVAIPRHRIYIVPTRFGYGYGALLMVMLLGAMNYSNSMAFALTFLLAGLGLLGMHHTHANLLNLRLRAGKVAPVFAGEAAQFEVWVDNPTPSARYTLAIGWPDDPPAAYVDVVGGGSSSAQLPLQAAQRGWLRAPRFAVATEFPLGLLHAWTWIELDMNTVVYPRPAAAGRQPPAAPGDFGVAASERPGVDEFIGLRGYAPGDVPRSIHWKSYAKLDVPQVKRFGETVARERVLDFALLPELDTEARLSQLSRWVLDADRAREPYALVLPGLRLAADLGDSHRAACLRALALYGLS